MLAISQRHMQLGSSQLAMIVVLALLIGQVASYSIHLGQPRMAACDAVQAPCSQPGVDGCASFSIANGQSLPFQPSSQCAGQQHLVVDSLAIVSTAGGNNFVARLSDWGWGDASESSVTLIPAAQTSTGCYSLTRPYMYKATGAGSNSGLLISCSDPSGCAGTIQASTTCKAFLGTPPTQCQAGPLAGTAGTQPPVSKSSPCSADNPTLVRGDDDTEYCCADSSMSYSFGQYGYCTCSMQARVDGGWSAWSSCDKTTCSQTRSCTDPAPSGGGAQCTGPSSQACSEAECSQTSSSGGSDPNPGPVVSETGVLYMYSDATCGTLFQASPFVVGTCQPMGSNGGTTTADGFLASACSASGGWAGALYPNSGICGGSPSVSIPRTPSGTCIRNDGLSIKVVCDGSGDVNAASTGRSISLSAMAATAALVAGAGRAWNLL